VTGAKQTTDGQDYTTAYTFTLAGALDTETYPSGRVVKNYLNNDGTLSMVESRKDANTPSVAGVRAIPPTGSLGRHGRGGREFVFGSMFVKLVNAR
jgi:hypothetical protein